MVIQVLAALTGDLGLLFPAPTWWFTTQDSDSRVSGVLSWLSQARIVTRTHMQAKTHIHKD